MVDRHIIDYINVHTDNYDTFIETFCNFMATQAVNCEDIIFQSNFSFGGLDCPCTVYIHQDVDKRFNTAKVTIQSTDNDWYLFKITDYPMGLMREWDLNDSLQPTYPNWKEMSPVDIFKDYVNSNKEYLTDNQYFEHNRNDYWTEGMSALIDKLNMFIYPIIVSYCDTTNDKFEHYNDSYIAVIYKKELADN